jgi:tetratricopeptide (TPR) repeat protein
MRFKLPVAGLFLIAAAWPVAAQQAPERTPSPEQGQGAQGGQAPSPNDKGKWIEPPADLNHKDLGKEAAKNRRADQTRSLDFLFEALKVAPDDSSAKAIEQRIWAAWMVSKSDTANLLMVRARAAAEAKNNDLALQLLTSIVTIRPDYVEAWNRRATLNFMRKDYGAALADLTQVLRREPRHFGALSGLGLILQEIGDEKHALDAYRKAIEVYPRLENIQSQIDKLKEKVEGRDI